MLTRLHRSLLDDEQRGVGVLSITAFAFRSVPGVVRSALPFVFLAALLLVLGGVLSTRFSTLGFLLMLSAFWPILLAGFWIQWCAGAQVSTDCEFNNRWLILPPREWLLRTAPLVFVLAAGFVILLAFGKAALGGSTFGVVVWPLLLAACLMFILLAATGLSSVAAAQEIDADMSGHSSTGGKAVVINLIICLVSFVAVTVVLGPVLFLLAIMLGVGEGWTTPLLTTCLIVLTWAASSAASAFMLEDSLWHTDFYD